MNHQLSNETKPDCLGYIGDYTASYMGIKSLQGLRIPIKQPVYWKDMERKRVFFVAQLESITRPLPIDGMSLHFFFLGGMKFW